MKRNKLKIIINVPVSNLFNFTINPKNTPLWIKSITVEKTNNWPIKIGSTYRNSDIDGNWSEFDVTKLKINEVFELKSKDGFYFVRYSYKPLDKQKSELEYLEWVEKGNLEDPFDIKVLKSLKNVLEDNS